MKLRESQSTEENVRDSRAACCGLHCVRSHVGCVGWNRNLSLTDRRKTTDHLRVSHGRQENEVHDHIFFQIWDFVFDVILFCNLTCQLHNKQIRTILSNILSRKWDKFNFPVQSG